jgi:Zn-dependent M28 family amino/carboxypeptidase
MRKLFQNIRYCTLPELLLIFSIVLLAIFSPLRAVAAVSTPVTFRGAIALADTREAVAFGERPSGSAANQKLREWIVARLKPLGGQLIHDSFTAQTPTGAVPMENIILRFPGKSGRAIAVTGHYDTKKIPMVHFLGANDGGSSTGFLIEFANVMAKTAHKDDIYVVFFDGEEAVVQWTDRDSVYGSRHLASKWASDGTLGRLKALINVDMIGDKDLDVMNDGNSNPGLVQAMLTVADRLGDGKFFHKDRQGIEDDHIPFAESGVNVLDIIDFNYGPNNGYWHNAKDTMDKLGEKSFQVVGDVVVGLVRELDGR